MRKESAALAKSELSLKALVQEHKELEKKEKSAVAPAPFKKLSPEKIEAIVLDHRDHGRRLAWSFLTTWRIRMKQDEVISIVGAALCEAANRFDENRGVAFKTFFFYHLRGMLLKEISRMIHEQRVLQFYPHSVLSEGSTTDSSLYAGPPIVPIEQNNPERLIEKKEVAELTWGACSQLDELEQEVIVRHFVHDQPLIDIANELKYCRCHISRVKSRGLAKLQRYLKSRFGNTEPQETERLSVEARAAMKGKSYTGGRGRRRLKIGLTKAEKIRKIA